ncbi:MAG TPA: PIG-L family deacetylase [Micromonosporaceae bacterium]
MSPALFIAAHPDDETLAMGVAIVEHLAAGQDVHILWMTRGEASGVRSKLNATSPTPNSWWGVMHSPEDEGYANPLGEALDLAAFGVARMAEANTAMAALASGLPGTLTPHEAGLPDGGVAVFDAQAAILTLCDDIAPGGQVRLKTHTWRTQLDNHGDHIATGTAARNLAVADPARFGDLRHYLLPAYWSDPDLTLVGEVWDLPSDAGVAARAVNAARAYGAWAPPHRFAVGHHSTYGMFATVMAGPKCLFHA